MRRCVVGTVAVIAAMGLAACADAGDAGRSGRPRTAVGLDGGRSIAQDESAPSTTFAADGTGIEPAPTWSWHRRAPYWWGTWPVATSTTTVAVGSTTTTTIAATTTTTTAATTSTTAATTTTTTVPVPVPGQANPVCIVTVAAGDSLDAIASAARARLADDEITFAALQVENLIPNPDRIDIGQVVDVCPNGFDDATGAKRPEFVPPPPLDVPQGGTNFGSGVVAQQQKLNELLTPYGFPALSEDGQSGRQTRQALCAARMGLGLPASREDMAPGSGEEMQLQAAGGLRIPERSDTGYNRWALIDLHCQVMFAGEGRDGITFVFPISSGEGEYPTRLQSASRAFRFDPALANGGWHDSTDYPVTVDNPLNGNMYKPVYFDGGQAIHGANSVPTSPASKGCVRMRVGHQELFINWLGLGDVERELWDATDRIGLAVTIIGQY